MGELDKETIRAVIDELREEGCLHGCPWTGVHPEKIDAIKQMEPLPEGAVRMVLTTWTVLSGFGKRVGNAVAAGLFILICTAMVAGAFGIGKVVQLCLSLTGK